MLKHLNQLLYFTKLSVHISRVFLTIRNQKFNRITKFYHLLVKVACVFNGKKRPNYTQPDLKAVFLCWRLCLNLVDVQNPVQPQSPGGAVTHCSRHAWKISFNPAFAILLKCNFMGGVVRKRISFFSHVFKVEPFLKILGLLLWELLRAEFSFTQFMTMFDVKMLYGVI